ncbi:helix-turn-helix transcriptional regulator [Wenxinia marina]|uniref:Putative transcriptional regulator n=1 Tax=Wenxinia marina DSM 24838 TaxID=1123501 RepID=A0A0D0QDW9_9RHOB|nr:YafY family protein [Wenxinia marina]KIQ70567.1 putative transcriptional regulator [Wenxinia marina DSM 24838]GGL52099.1 transcriptional regulator [Wenxinia marina]
MSRQDRLFELIQTLRAAEAPRTAQALAGTLEVSVRTVYRDIATLQAMRVPVEGAAGIGYVLRRGYDLPPLNFDTEEAEALRVGLALLARTGDSALVRAGQRVRDKIAALHGPAAWLNVAPFGAPFDDPHAGCVPVALIRQAVREERKLEIDYRVPDGEATCRVIRPLVVIYHLEVKMVAAWCELRHDFRHFRLDRIWGCTSLPDSFAGQGDALRTLWAEREGVDKVAAGLA